MSAPEKDDRRITDDLGWLDGQMRRARDNAEQLADNELRFIDDLARRLESYGADTYLSPRQRAWLEDIGGRLDKAGVPVDADDPGDEVARPVDEVLR